MRAFSRRRNIFLDLDIITGVFMVKVFLSIYFRRRYRDKYRKGREYKVQIPGSLPFQ
jgi:hypothetical protein